MKKYECLVTFENGAKAYIIRFSDGTFKEYLEPCEANYPGEN